MADEVNLIITLNRPQYPVLATDQIAYVYVEAQPTAVVLQAGVGHTPLNLALVLDRSGSMAGQKITDLKEAAKWAVEQLDDRDQVSIVVFDDRAEVIVPSQPAVNKTAVLAQIERIDERGGTSMSLGIQQGLDQLQAGAGPGRVSRMLLLTDGETWEDEGQCRQLAQQAAQMGIPLTALGLGEEWNQNLLTDLASLSGGTWEYIDTPDKMAPAFSQVVQAMQGVVATNASLTLRLVTGVRPRAVWRVAPLIDRLSHNALSERDVQVYLGDLPSKGQSVLVELTMPPRQAGDYRMVQAELMYDAPGSQQTAARARQDVMVTFTGDEVVAQGVNGRVMNVVEKVTAFKLQTQALDEAAVGQMAGATRKLRAAATRLLNLGETEMAQQAQAAADQMEAGQQLSGRETKRLYTATRKLDMSDLLG
ncbi:MAG: VWA domain-containing protein [Anaerolinea sp.]|nr:VWA domain-containing protein [Anaerolinea sp.]